MEVLHLVIKNVAQFSDSVAVCRASTTHKAAKLAAETIRINRICKAITEYREHFFFEDTYSETRGLVPRRPRRATTITDGAVNILGRAIFGLD